MAAIATISSATLAVGAAPALGQARSAARHKTVCTYRIDLDRRGDFVGKHSITAMKAIAVHAHPDAHTPGAYGTHIAGLYAIVNAKKYRLTKIYGTASNGRWHVTRTAKTLSYDVTMNGKHPKPTAYITHATICAKAIRH